LRGAFPTGIERPEWSLAVKLFFSAGEPSGDVHSAELIGELQRRMPGCEVYGFGGPAMERAGCRSSYRLTDLAVMGFASVVPHLWKFGHLALRARRWFQRERPDAVVLVDFPGFNWWIARFAKAQGIPVFYYLPPQIWAWASYRVERMRRYVDHVLCCFPFEPDWYAAREVRCEYVGHPIFDEITSKPLDAEFLAQERLRSGSIVGVLPGSRDREVRENFPVQLQIMDRLQRCLPAVRFLVANYRDDQRRLCERHTAAFGNRLPIDFHVGRTSEIIELADVCMMVSGSVSLELLVRSTPAIVMYRASWALAWFCRHVVECGYISLPNLAAGRMLFPEYYLVGPTKTYIPAMVDQLAWWLTDDRELAHRRRQLVELRDRMCSRGAVARAAQAIIEKLRSLPMPVAA
jgi:lipid-A-disaccharide synthase